MPRIATISLEGARERTKQVLTYHAPTGEQVDRYNLIRDAVAHAYETIEDNCPPCADRTAALRKLREAMMTANASIALAGAV